MASCFTSLCPQTIRFTPALVKSSLLNDLDALDTLNEANAERTKRLNDMIRLKSEVPVPEVLRNPDRADLSIEKPGLWDSMKPVAPGVWKVLYAPHMATISKLIGGGQLDVQYSLNDDGTLESHAKWKGFPWIPNDTESIYLSVSGAYGSESENECNVQWDQAWVKIVKKGEDDIPYARVSDVPESLMKNAIIKIGRLMFIRPFSVFPISFLNNEMIVFDFPLLATRIFARKL